MNARRLGSIAVVSCAIAAWLCGGSANAAITHHFLYDVSEIPAHGPKGEAVPLPGPISLMDAMTVDSGHLWVAEHIDGTDSFRVDEFDAQSGAFESQLPQPGSTLDYFDQGIAVGHATGEAELYVGADSYPEGSPEGAVAVYGPKNELQGTWT